MNTHVVPAVVVVTGFDGAVISRHCEKCGQPVVQINAWWEHTEPGDTDDGE